MTVGWESFEGYVARGVPLARYTWFRVGGPADLLVVPKDESDLMRCMGAISPEIPVTVLGLGSNVLVRDGGIAGAVVRLGKGFSALRSCGQDRIEAGASVPVARLARFAERERRTGLEFFRGIPGSVGGAIAMNAGAHGRETADVLHSVRYVDRGGAIVDVPAVELAMSYRSTHAPPGAMFVSAQFRVSPGEVREIRDAHERVLAARAASQPLREKTGGSTFKNPQVNRVYVRAWELIDRAGCRGWSVGDACLSPVHCNFMINRGSASAADLETLGEKVRACVLETQGIDLEWEIKRLGRHKSRAPVVEIDTASTPP